MRHLFAPILGLLVLALAGFNLSATPYASPNQLPATTLTPSVTVTPTPTDLATATPTIPPIVTGVIQPIAFSGHVYRAGVTLPIAGAAIRMTCDDPQLDVTIHTDPIGAYNLGISGARDVSHVGIEISAPSYETVQRGYYASDLLYQPHQDFYLSAHAQMILPLLVRH